MTQRALIVCAISIASTQMANATTFQENSINFAAPIVQTHTTLPSDIPFGSIIYDNTASAFMGLSDTGTWQTLTDVNSGANRALSNLASTAVNADILPGTNNTINLGNSSLSYANVATTTLNGLAVGIGLGNQSSNVVVGNGAFASNVSGQENTVVGSTSMQANTSGSQNTAIGKYAMNGNVSGRYNVGVGWGALAGNGMTGNGNIGIGNGSLNYLTSGYGNDALGTSALNATTTGFQNIGIGDQALSGNQVSSSNIAIGYDTLVNFVGPATSTYNVAIGVGTGGGIVTGVANTIIGSQVTGLAAGLSNNIIIADGSGNRRINVDNNGNTGIGTITPTTTLQVAGEISPSADNSYTLGDASLRFTAVYAVNGTIQTSDAREKKDVVDADLGLDFIQKLRPVSFHWKNKTDANLHYGFIAQETQKAVADTKNSSSQEDTIVSRDPKSGLYGLNYSELIAPTVKAVQEVAAAIQGNSQEIAVLKAENAELKVRLEKLEKAIEAK